MTQLAASALPGRSPSYKRPHDSSFYSFRFSASFNLVSCYIADWFAICLMTFIQLAQLFDILCHIWYKVSSQPNTHAWCWLVRKSKKPTCPAETCSVIRILMSFTYFVSAEETCPQHTGMLECNLVVVIAFCAEVVRDAARKHRGVAG